MKKIGTTLMLIGAAGLAWWYWKFILLLIVVAIGANLRERGKRPPRV